MKVYFYTKNEDNDEKITQTHERIIQFFKENGVDLISNLTHRTHQQEHLSFEDMNGLVVEGRGSVQEVGYLVALALAQQKPILYLLPKGAILPDQLRSLKDNKKLHKLFLLRYYSERTLNSFLIDFIDLIETGELRREVPTIKFTLRFTPRSSRYINWKAKQKKISKADYLRKLIDGQIAGDELYQSFLRKPKNDAQSRD
ncbi:hypothetical protein KJ840_02425 [Patescibacteria group bacterium]|nr:hypothetical protein [Patescibacteria group bacterium]